MKTILLDIDDTILDFHECAKATILRASEDFGVTFTDEMLSFYMEQNAFLWGQYEKGIITREDIFRTRFPMLFKEYGYNVDGIEFENAFQKYFKTQYKFVDGAVELVDYLSKKYDLYVASNSLYSTQVSRLTNAGLINHFKDLFVSDAIGYQKPTKEFFEGCFCKILNFSKEETIIIGDSLSSDIKGGCRVGIKTCWFNPKKLENNTEYKADYEVTSLDEIRNIL
ncbi:MAG: YjjG family noncanonical pyrimidine nucleotidase [Candidatus Gastranaerophilales bacterium]|nr:YjjG family noncanonical pyrimidine nucleotidase [Candidatus Gastranaerophilales bacterium]